MITAVYGGSFNPPHLGHTAAAMSVAREVKPDRFLIIPDYIAPHKKMAESSPEPEQRLEMCRLAFREVPGAEISDMEISRGGRSYTVDTMTELHKIYPGDDFHLVIGSDMLLSFSTGWYRFEDILAMCTLEVLSREKNDMDSLEQAAEILRRDYAGNVNIIQNHEILEMSSSQIRECLAEGGGEGLLDADVFRYIVENNLYNIIL